MTMHDLISSALRALGANRGRSLLTISGIVIGITAVIAMTSLIGGVRNYMMGSLGLNASRLLNISGNFQMSQKDLKKLERLVPDYEFVKGRVYGSGEQRVNGVSMQVSINGTDAEYLNLTGAVKIADGRMFNPSEEVAAARVIIIGKGAVKMLFGDAEIDAVGKTVSIGSRDYTIVGVDEAGTVSAGQDPALLAYVPLKTCIRDYPDTRGSENQVMGLVRQGADLDAVADETKTQLAKIKGIAEKDIDQSITISSIKSQMDSMNMFMGAFQLIMGTVAGISLLVGGIGIMNMMLTNVTERIREIGVRRSLGARRHDITTQFLVESAVLCVSGGVIGTVLGYMIAFGIAAAASAIGSSYLSASGQSLNIQPDFSLVTIALAVGLSVFIGIVFGFYPARRAARLDPVESLRYQ
ncbi:protein of unknown function DUF214 [Coriobacterium glomerans PW2]|uniref:ABC3 transporter permease protein domain-containing protein n=1 Tax=Coriobacterium glomerans (strain ATCC 49209 / DSM 20642 / JCM 10262 / PW2) TaxID=700015 RepID=F2N814_CORGP|nr:ABC transporter permease [Coriobacterium glomerans]AEB07197.1 protein of unknown function DUF214 [Coriobacterium glomerans PW2]